MNRILLDPDPNDWAKSLAPELQPVITAKGWKGPGDVVSSYVNLEKTLGADKMLSPQKTWGDKEWGDFYGKIGRPETSDKYEIPADVKLNEGLKIDDSKLKVAKDTFHKLGLSSKQASEVMRFYLGTLNESDTAFKTGRDAELNAGMRKLQEEFGDKHTAQIDLAKSVVSKFGGEELVKYLNDSGLGNHPSLIKAFAKIGAGMLEDPIKGKGSGLDIQEPTRALQEIERMKMDKEFQVAINTMGHPGHQAAVDQWLAMHKLAHPGKVE